MSNMKNTAGPEQGMEYTPGIYVPQHSDMTLRDHFAGLAMQGLIAGCTVDYDEDKVAESSYKMADEMLKAREQ